MPHLAKISVPEYENNKPKWNKFSWLNEGGDALIAQMRALPEETVLALQNRQALAVDFADISGEVQSQIDILTQSGISVEINNNDVLADLFAAKDGMGVDGNGSTLMQFMLMEILRPALIYGRSYPIVDRTALPPGLSQIQVEKMENPYSYVLNPLEVPAFQYTNSLKTEFRAVISKTLEETHSDPNGFPDGEEDFFTLWTWEQTVKQNRKGDQIQVVPNEIGVVPILRFELGQSFLKNLWNPVMSMMEHFSLASLGGSSQIYGMMAIFSNQAAKTIDAGFNKALHLPVDAKIQVIHTPVEGIKYNADFADRIKKHIDKTLKNNMISMTVTAVQQSGVSKKMDQIGQEQFSHFLASEIERFLPRYVQLFARYLTPDKIESTDVKTHIPEQFVTRDRDGDRKDAEFLSSKFNPSTDAQLQASSQTIRELTGIEDNMTPDEIMKDNEEIKKLTIGSPGTQPPGQGAAGSSTPSSGNAPNI